MPSRAGIYPTFIALDEDGRRHVLRVMLGLLGGPRRVVLDGGGELERIGRGEYLTPWGERLTSDDPDAP